MPWNWELPNWPQFTYQKDELIPLEREFLLREGHLSVYLKNTSSNDARSLIIEILSIEGETSSKIEGEILDRASLQSSIRRHFGLQIGREHRPERAMATLLCDLYDTYDQPLCHEMIWKWHQVLFDHDTRLSDKGKYRTHLEPMQIVSHRMDAPRIYFEAPPSSRIPAEMEQFMSWFNEEQFPSILGKAAIAHVYFESIHPFEDGNGRIGRVLAEKILSQGVGHPTIIAISKILEKRKKEYYSALERCNRSLEATEWVYFFAEVILQAQQESIALVDFLIAKSKMLTTFHDQLNPRQEKALLRMFEAGIEGFTGGLSAEKYMSITKASRATATRDLTDLVEKGALVRKGEFKHARYFLFFRLPE